MNLLSGHILSGQCAVLFSEPVIDVQPSLSFKNKEEKLVAWFIIFNMKEDFVKK